MSAVLERSFAAVLVLFAVFFHPPAMQGQSLTITTFAGTPGVGVADGTGSAARFRQPNGVATDSSGNVYVADTGNHTIRKITPAGAVTTLAGLAESSGSADGKGSAARFDHPNGVATDSSGNVYVADTDNSTIRKITPAGAVTTLAGRAGYDGSTDGTASAARFYRPQGVATDSSGNVYVADTSSHTIRKITPTGAVTTLAGLAGNSGSADGTGSAARFKNPNGAATDSSGNVYVADTNNSTIRKITPAGEVTTLASLAGTYGSADGTGSAARFNLPSGVATDSGGNVYVADRSNYTIRKITPAGVVTTLAGLALGVGGADGTGSAAQFNGPSGVATDSGGNVYVADRGNSTIRKITPAGEVTTLAGLAGARGFADGTGSAARFSDPSGVATDNSGNVYVADTSNESVRKITPAGAVTKLAGGSYGNADGTGNAAQFNNPTGVATDSSGNVYVADSSNNTIRKITPAGAVTTLAGLALTSGSADGTGSAARFNNPRGVATDSSGNVYVADTWNHTIRKITPGGAVTTLAGLATAPRGSADGTASAARFNNPWGVTTDSGGNLYVADRDNSTIRMITPAGVVTTLAGLAGTMGSADGTGSAARFNSPVGVATDSGSGNVYIADYYVSSLGNNTIRLGRATLADVATIDLSTGSPGSTRQLDTSIETATSWQWSVVRRPVDAVADFSSATVRNPTFTPDVPGLFTFRLIAWGATAASISTVDFMSITSPPGDPNGDGQVTAADIFYLINNLFAGGPSPVGSGDANGDGSVTAGDVFYLINYLFAGGPAPANVSVSITSINGSASLR